MNTRLLEILLFHCICHLIAEHLQSKLDEYLKRFHGKVRLVRNKEREGLIRSRSIGAENAREIPTCSVFMLFLCLIYWSFYLSIFLRWRSRDIFGCSLRGEHKLADPIAGANSGEQVRYLFNVSYYGCSCVLIDDDYYRKIMTVPVIDGIDMNTWAYHPQYGGSNTYFRYLQCILAIASLHRTKLHLHFCRGIFEWGLLYKESEITSQELARLKYPAEPFRSPTHAGGLFAINREWFAKLGYYDAGLQIWGGEQYELSFKVGILVKYQLCHLSEKPSMMDYC